MPTLRNEADRKRLVERLGRVTPATRAQWGSLDAPGMMCHLGNSMDAAQGKLQVTPGGPWMLRHFPMKHLALYVIPMPKGAKAPRELLAPAPGGFEADRRRVVEGIARMAAMPGGPGPVHFLFGAMTYDQWNALNWKHIDHHLRQFGS
jgi:Protein of unknown function (DUF1569)